jgi:hypothetical protein
MIEGMLIEGRFSFIDTAAIEVEGLERARGGDGGGEEDADVGMVTGRRRRADATVAVEDMEAAVPAPAAVWRARSAARS